MHPSKCPATFVVSGKGKFPIDMLRHDVATPADEIASANIEVGTGQRTVRLHTRQSSFITPDRWRSFGWSVVDEADTHS